MVAFMVDIFPLSLMESYETTPIPEPDIIRLLSTKARISDQILSRVMLSGEVSAAALITFHLNTTYLEATSN